MIVYHGTTTWKMHSLLDGDFTKKFGGLFVTDTRERASHYANSVSKQEVTEHTFPLVQCAVVVAIEVDEDVKWLRRPESHGTLDKCEALIQHGRIVEMWVGRPSRLSFQEHTNIEKTQVRLPNVNVHIFDDSLPNH